MDRAVFFDAVRHDLFAGRLRQGQVEGMEVILDEFERRKWDDLRWLAYILATTYHETGPRRSRLHFQPRREMGRGRGRKYGRPDPETGQVYYGRGYVQLTWRFNYKKAGDYLGLDLVNDPDRAMAPDVAVKILFSGMRDGWFTGKGLSRYLSDRHTDWRQARRIVNGLDKAAQIAGYARQFHAAIKAASSTT